jgi:outer membrane immunogenic protein
MRIPAIALAFVLIGCGVAAAADPAPEISPDIDQARYGWTGFYAGGSAGWGWLKDTDYAPPPGFPNPLDDKGDDFVFGAHAGYLYQYGDFVVGAEAEAMKLDITYDLFNFITFDNSYALKARLGYSIDRFLLSGHAGAVYAETNFNDLKDWGWVAGANVDYALTDNILVGAQYTHYGFTEFDGTQIDGTIDLVTARMAYKF